MDACTIVARRDLARARVLAGSYLSHHPESGFTVLVLDGVEGADAVEGVSVLTLEQLIGADGLGMLAAGNSLPALEVAALPALLRHLHGARVPANAGSSSSTLVARPAGAAPVAYLAASLRVLGPLEELERLAAEHELVVVARVGAGLDNGRLAFDGREGGGAISHRVLVSSGGARATSLLDRWPRYFANGEKAVHDWFDGLPTIGEDVGVLRDPAYAVDMWTLSAERVDEGAQGLQVEGHAVRLVDLGQLDPHAPERPNHARKDARLHSIAALSELRRRHAEELLAAGYEQAAVRHWRYAALRDGAPMTELLRKLFLEGVEDEQLTCSPFLEEGRRAFYEYLQEPAQRGAAAGLTRLHEEIWKLRPDVQAAYPHLDGPDGARFAVWLCEHAREDHGVPEALLPQGARAPGQARADIDVREPLWGVNVAGFFTSELGLGEAARLLISGLDARNVPALPVQAQLVPPCGQGAEFTYCSPQDAPYPISIVCINGDLIAPFAREAGTAFFEGRHTIALWWWEASDLPEDWKPAFEHIDEVWVGSQPIYDAIAPSSPVPVVKMTMPVALPRVPVRSRAELGLPEGFLFLYVHDYHSTAARKNPLGVVEAFKRAFPPGSGAKLVVKSINAENVLHEHDRVALAAAEHPDIALVDAYVSAGEKNAMIAACDCYVSLHRSEGFGLTAAEAMLLGKPVIATRYGGNLEFMTEQNSYLVDWTPTEVGEDAHPYPAGGIWADPDLDQAAARMREVFADPRRARERAERGRGDVVASHAPAVAGERMEGRLRAIYERLVRDGARSVNVAHAPASLHPELGELIAGEPALAPGNGARARAKRALQRVFRRGLRPLTTRQRMVNARLHSEVEQLREHLHRVATELQARQEARFAETLAAVRALKSGMRDTHVGLEALERLVQAIEDLQPAQRLQALEQLGRQVEHHLAQHRATPYVSEERGFDAWQHAIAGPVVGYRSGAQTPLERHYVDFEATFRGPEERVLEIQRAYLPLLEDQAPVLDVGCGRGELLDLLAEAGVAASGVDLDAGMAEHARAKGHDVALGDGVEHLRGLKPGSLGAVVAIEVIEHLPYERLIELLELARSRLRSDGLLLLETVNPHAVDAMKAFWVDPTHQHPVFPEVALELCRLAGFGEAFWFHPSGMGEFDTDRNSQPIYAVAASASGGTPPGFRISSHS